MAHGKCLAGQGGRGRLEGVLCAELCLVLARSVLTARSSDSRLGKGAVGHQG